MNSNNIAPSKIKSDIGRLIDVKREELDKLTRAYDAFSGITAPADMPTSPTVPAPGEKIDRRKFNGGNSTKAKDPSKDGRRYNGKKKGSGKKTARKRSTVKA